jgi:hypothetical protein
MRQGVNFCAILPQARFRNPAGVGIILFRISYMDSSSVSTHNVLFPYLLTKKQNGNQKIKKEIQ